MQALEIALNLNVDLSDILLGSFSIIEISMVAEYPATNTISKNRNDYYCDLDYGLKATANLGEFRLPFLGWSQDLSSYSEGIDVHECSAATVGR